MTYSSQLHTTHLQLRTTYSSHIPIPYSSHLHTLQRLDFELTTLWASGAARSNPDAADRLLAEIDAQAAQVDALEVRCMHIACLHSTDID